MVSSDVLKLPPKVSIPPFRCNRSKGFLQNEVIVPVSMTAIQREVYKSLLSKFKTDDPPNSV